MLKYWRVWILLVVLLAATLAISFKAYPYGRVGVEVVYVSDSSPAKEFISGGMLVSEINGEKISSVSQFNRIAAEATGTVNIIANGQSHTITLGNNTLGIQAKELERTNLGLGLDLQGGTRIILAPEGNSTSDIIDSTISTLQTRANLFGLQEILFSPITDISGKSFIQVEATGVGREVVTDLLSRQGKFEARILKPIDFEGSTGTLVLGEQSFPVSVSNTTITLQGSQYSLGDTFTVGGIDFEYSNFTAGRAILLGLAYRGEDIELVHTDPQRSGIIPSAGGYNFYFTVSISQTGAQRFADITSGIPKYLDINSGEEYLDSSITLYLDEDPVSDLRIGAGLAGEVVTEPQITGGRDTEEEAIQERLQLQTILRSGALPVKLTVQSVDVISPTLGSNFFESAGYAAIIAGILVVVIVFIRYRSIRISIPMIFIGFAEIAIILGIASSGDQLIWAVALFVNLGIIGLAAWKKEEIDISAWLGGALIPIIGLAAAWTIDLAAVAGIVAAIGTSVDHQIIIADETVRGRLQRTLTLKEKIKQAFFIIFGAAATLIVAMIPLIILGIGLVRGFAITTIIGVLVGVLITRPAYSRIIEIFYKDD